MAQSEGVPTLRLRLPTNQQISRWLSETRNREKAHKVRDLWNDRFGKWQRGEWGSKNWSRDEASRRAAAYARGYYHFLRFRDRKNRLLERLKIEYPKDQEAYKRAGDAEKKKILAGLPPEERHLFYMLSRWGWAETRAMDLMKTIAILPREDPGHPNGPLEDVNEDLNEIEGEDDVHPETQPEDQPGEDDFSEPEAPAEDIAGQERNFPKKGTYKKGAGGNYDRFQEGEPRDGTANIYVRAIRTDEKGRPIRYRGNWHGLRAKIADAPMLPEIVGKETPFYMSVPPGKYTITAMFGSQVVTKKFDTSKKFFTFLFSMPTAEELAPKMQQQQQQYGGWPPTAAGTGGGAGGATGGTGGGRGGGGAGPGGGAPGGGGGGGGTGRIYGFIWRNVEGRQERIDVDAGVRILELPSNPYSDHVTPPNNRYEITALPEGTYHVECSAAGYGYQRPKAITISTRRGDVRQDFFYEGEPRETGYEPEGIHRFTRGWLDWLNRHVMGNVLPLVIAILGFVISSAMQELNFLWGFLSWAAYLVLPKRVVLRDVLEDVNMNIDLRDIARDPRRFGANLLSGGLGALDILRTAFKMAAITLFSIGLINSPMPFANLLLIIVAFVGYFSMPVEYHPRNSMEFLESTVRFGFLGCYVLPWMIFSSVFDSVILGFVALSFFAIPPFPRRERAEDVEIQTMFQMLDKGIFFVVMVLALIWSGALVAIPGASNIALFQPVAGWELKGTLASTFLFFWLTTFVVGLFSPPQERPIAGFIMLGAATIIFALGPGTQQIGSALFGPFFPTVFKGLNDVATPLTTAFGAFGASFGPAIQLLTNPIAFAQNITEGSYARDPLSNIQGAYGVEIEEFKAAQSLILGTPYILTAKIANQGAFEATNVYVNISLGQDKSKPRTHGDDVQPLGIALKGDPESIGLNELGFSSSVIEGNEFACHLDPKGKIDACTQYIDGSRQNMLTRLDRRQVFFQSDPNNLLSCRTVIKYNLRERFLPFMATVSYDYEISSNFDIEFISREEWDRKTQEGLLISQEKRPSTFTNAPVQLNIDSFEQPIREGTPFYLGLQMKPGPRGGKVESVYNFSLKIPAGLKKYLTRCFPLPSNAENLIEFRDGSTDTLVWQADKIPPSNTILCQFLAIDFNDFVRNSTPSISFLVSAESSYRFAKSLDTVEKLEFGGIACCAKDTDCPITGQVCNTDTKVCGIGFEDMTLPGGEEFCSSRIEKGRSACRPGMGGCTVNEECDLTDLGNKDGPLMCRGVSGLETNICCYQSEADDKCRDRFETWLKNPTQ